MKTRLSREEKLLRRVGLSVFGIAGADAAASHASNTGSGTSESSSSNTSGLGMSTGKAASEMGGGSSSVADFRQADVESVGPDGWNKIGNAAANVWGDLSYEAQWEISKTGTILSALGSFFGVGAEVGLNIGGSLLGPVGAVGGLLAGMMFDGMVQDSIAAEALGVAVPGRDNYGVASFTSDGFGGGGSNIADASIIGESSVDATISPISTVSLAGVSVTFLSDVSLDWQAGGYYFNQQLPGGVAFNAAAPSMPSSVALGLPVQDGGITSKRIAQRIHFPYEDQAGGSIYSSRIA